MERRGLVLAPEALDELRAAALFAKDSLRLTWRSYAQESKIAQDRLEQFTLGRLGALDNFETMQLANYLRQSLTDECGFGLYEKFPVVFVNNSLADHLVRELNIDLDQQNSFYREQKGYYLLFTRNEHDGVAVALLKIVRPQRQPLPWFVTWEKTPIGLRRANGFIYGIDGRVVAIGRISGSDELRLSRLRIIHRESLGDMYGLRLGMSPAGREECSGIYCYKLGGEIRPGERKALTGVFQEKDFHSAFRLIKEPALILKRIDRPVFQIDIS
jgi:hypothetical protein